MTLGAQAETLAHGILRDCWVFTSRSRGMLDRTSATPLAQQPSFEVKPCPFSDAYAYAYAYAYA